MSIKNKKKLLLVSENKNKWAEWQSLLPDFEIELFPCSLLEIQSTHAEEVGHFKLRQALQQLPHTHADCVFVEDVALHINSLGGLPGALIKWFLEALGVQGLYALVQHEDNEATAVCAVNAVQLKPFNKHEKQPSVQFSAAVKGKIIAPSGEQGFGWDSIFLPSGQQQSYADVSLIHKNLNSHRSKCAEKFLIWLHRLP